jgi:hypothetical protein
MDVVPPRPLGAQGWVSSAEDRGVRKAPKAAGGTLAGVEHYEVHVYEVPSAEPVSGVTGTVGGVTGTHHRREKKGRSVVAPALLSSIFT